MLNSGGRHIILINRLLKRSLTISVFLLKEIAGGNSEPCADPCNSLEILFALVPAKQCIHLLYAHALGLGYTEEDPDPEEDTEC